MDDSILDLLVTIGSLLLIFVGSISKRAARKQEKNRPLAPVKDFDDEEETAGSFIPANTPARPKPSCADRAKPGFNSVSGQAYVKTAVTSSAKMEKVEETPEEISQTAQEISRFIHDADDLKKAVILKEILEPKYRQS